MKNFLTQLLHFLFPEAKRSARIAETSLEDFVPLIQRKNRVLQDVPITGTLPYRESLVQDLIWSLKYEKSIHAADICGALLHETLLEDLSDTVNLGSLPLLLIPVPLSAERERNRGYNQAGWIAIALEKKLHGRGILTEQVLMRTRNTPVQTTLTREKRLQNIKGAFTVRDPQKIRGRHCVLIDDVVTTGSTLYESYKTLIENGAASVLCVAVAYAGKI